MRVPFVWIDAFATAPFEGNPAAVVPLPHWLPDAVLQQIAAQNGLSETAFLISKLPPTAGDPHDDPSYHLRWFTPAVEVDLCGHATLASASYLLDDVHPDASRVRFWTRSGWLTVERHATDTFTMDFPSQPPHPVDPDPAIVAALGGVDVVQALRSVDLVYVLPDADAVARVEPDLVAISRLPVRGLIITAPGDGTPFDFVSRFFGAQAGVGEDPVTGSAHSQIAPMWAQRLGRDTADSLVARQLSARGGTMTCQVAGERTLLTGACRRYLTGTAELPD